MDVLLLPDTNIFLHFPPLADIDWLTVAGAASAEVLLAPVVSRELNEHKDAPRNRKLHDRAFSALKELSARYRGIKRKEIRPGVKIEFLTHDPAIDFAQYGLVRDLNDDWLIATALQVKADNAGVRVAIVTARFWAGS